MSRRDAPILPERTPYGPDPEQFVDHYRPDVAQPIGTAISFHGGYWRARYGLDINTAICHHLVNRGWEVVNVEYRRIESDDTASVWPQMRADVSAAVAWAAGLSTDRNRTVIAVGHSAGGHLALWAAGQQHSPIDGVVALAPVSDLESADREALSSSAAAVLLGGRADEIPDIYADASPIRLLPLAVPQLIVHASGDDDVPVDMSAKYVAAAIAAHDEAVHLNPADADHFTIIDPRTPVWRDIDDWMDSFAGRGRPNAGANLPY